MKRTFSFLMMVIMLACAFGFGAKPASAAGLISYMDGRFISGKGIAFVFEASGYGNRQVRGATIFIGSSFYHLGCTVNRQDDRIVCVAGGGLTQYAGQTGIIHLAGQIFYVIIPDKGVKEPQGCGLYEILGADVEFSYTLSSVVAPISGGTFSTFISGNSLSEIQQEAQARIEASEGVYTGYTIIGNLHCAQPAA